MKYIDTQLSEAIEYIHASELLKSSPDGRRAARASVQVSVAIKREADPEAKWTETTLFDISVRGIGLESASAMEIDSTFLLRFPNEEKYQSHAPLICRVASCVKGKRFFKIGAEFVGRLTTAEMGEDADAVVNRIRQSILA